MKNVALILTLLAAALAFQSCKAKQMAAVDPSDTVAELPVTEPEPEPPQDITVRTERFTFVRDEDKTQNEFFVILGSFQQSENADRFKLTLSNQGFDPIILLSETGFNRVCVNSYTDEFQARRRVQQIRTEFPQYHDAWLLIRKK